MFKGWYQPEYEPYVWNKAAQAAYDRLKKKKCVIIKGEAGVGKTVTARAIMKKYQEENPGCELIELDKIDDFSTKVDSSRDTVILVDDSIGRDEKDHRKRQDIFDKFARYWGTIYACIECGKLKAVINFRRLTLNKSWTSLLRYKLFREENVVEVETDDLKLTKANKRDIFEKHCAHNKITICTDEKDVNYESEKILIDSNPVRISESMVQQIVETEPLIGYPKAVRLFTKERKNTRLGVDFFKNPQQSTIEEMLDFRRETGTFMETRYCVLLYMLLNNGEIDAENTDDELKNKVKKSAESKARMARMDIRDALSEMTNKFVVKNEKDIYLFKHENIKEAVSIVYGEDNPEEAFQLIDFNIIQKFARTDGCETREREVTLPVMPSDYCHLAKRFLTERPIWTCVRHPAMDDEAFLKVFMKQVLENEELTELVNKNCFSSRGIFTKACIYGRLNFLKNLWEHFSKKMAPFVHDALALACRNDKTETVKWLLSLGTKLSDEHLTNPINDACRFGCVDCLQCIMDYRERLDVDRFARGLYQASFGGHREIIALLMSRRPDFTIEHKREAMSWAIVGGHVDALDYIFSSSTELANHEYMSITMFNTTIPFIHIAAFFGKYAPFIRLLTSGMLCDTHNSRITVLQAAMFGFKHPGIDFEYVSSYSIMKSDLFGHYCSGLYDAGKKFPPASEYCQILQYIIESPGREDTEGIDMKLDKQGNTLAHYCIINNTPSLLELLIEKFQDLVTIPNVQEVLPIQLAVYLGRTPLVALLKGVGTQEIPENGLSLKVLALQGKELAGCCFDDETDKPGILNCLEEHHPTVQFGSIEDFELIEKEL